jgi:AcrR family transcriptional regulator
MSKPPRPTPSIVAPADADPHVRTRLLHAGVHVFDRKGYAGASVREIAEMAGVTTPTLYYHFGSKEGLLVAILSAAQREFLALVARALERQGAARDRIVALCEDAFDLLANNVPVARVANAIYFGPPEGAPPFDLTVFESGFIAAIERLTLEGQAAGEIRPAPPSDIALAVGGILQGCTERQLHPAFTPVGRDDLVRLLTLLFEGISTPRRA